MLWGGRLSLVHNTSPTEPPQCGQKLVTIYCHIYTAAFLKPSPLHSSQPGIGSLVIWEPWLRASLCSEALSGGAISYNSAGRGEGRACPYSYPYPVTRHLFLLTALPSRRRPPHAQSPHSGHGVCSGHLWQCHAAPDVWKPCSLTSLCQCQSFKRLPEHFFRGLERLTFLKSLWNLLQYYFCFMFWLFGREVCGILTP